MAVGGQASRGEHSGTSQALGVKGWVWTAGVHRIVAEGILGLRGGESNGV
jgi:hypothetical protein